MDDGLTAWKILKENGVRHQTIKNYRYLELKKRMAATESEECEIMRGVRLQEAIEGLDRWSNDIYQELEITEE